MSTPCKPGRLSGLTFDNPDCATCRSISKIIQSVDDTTMTIYYTDGTSQIFTLPVSAPVSNGAYLIWSDPADHVTTTNGSFETLSYFSTDHTNAAKNLVNVGDTIVMSGIYKLVNFPTTTGILYRFIVNGVGLSSVAIGGFSVINASTVEARITTTMVLKDNTAGAMTARITSEIKVYEDGGFILSGQLISIPVIDIGGATVDFSVNDYLFSAQAQSVDVGDIKLQLFQAQKISNI